MRKNRERFANLPGFADALNRLDHVSGLRHRPATTLADRLAVNAQDPYTLALWNAHVARSLQNANALRAGAPAPRVAGRDPYALRGLVLIAVIATFIAADYKIPPCAGMAESVDAADSKSAARKGMRVRVSLPAPVGEALSETDPFSLDRTPLRA